MIHAPERTQGKHERPVVIQFGLDPEKVNHGLLNLVLLGFFAVELALASYIITLTLYETTLFK